MNDSTQSKTNDNKLIAVLTGLRDWVDARLPIVAAWKKHMSQYYAPNNFNFWYFFGVCCCGFCFYDCCCLVNTKTSGPKKILMQKKI